MADEEQNPFTDKDPLDDLHGKTLTEVLHEDDFVQIAPKVHIAREAMEGDVSRLAHGDVVFKWGRKDFGFGEFRFGIHPETGQPFVDTETMSPAFCLDVVIQALTPLLEAEDERWRKWFDERDKKKKQQAEEKTDGSNG